MIKSNTLPQKRYDYVQSREEAVSLGSPPRGRKQVDTLCLITDFNKEIAVLMWSSSLGKKKFLLSICGMES